MNAIDRANAEVIKRVKESVPELVGIGIAGEMIPDMDPHLILHAGPPITWDRMCGPMKGAVMGGLIYEGLADNPEDAEKLAASGKIRFDPCHHHATVGPMAGIVTSKMPVWIVKNSTYGNKAFCTLNEGLGKVLRYGAYSPEVIDRLRWMEKTLAPVLAAAIGAMGPMDLRAMMAQALQMGDECHNRNRAATSLLIREFAPYLVRTCEDREALEKVFSFMNTNDHFFLNLSMPACKAVMDSAADVKNSSILLNMARNGTDFGIRLCGEPDRWFVAEAPKVRGLYFPGYGDEDANPDIGDSVITESCGIGAFAMAAAPAIVQFVGGSPEDALKSTLSMYEITAGESEMYKVPALGFRGTPTGIDARLVTETGILPAINTGIAHRLPGVGQVGAGLVNPPKECFIQAIKWMDENLDKSEASCCCGSDANDSEMSAGEE